MRGTLFIVLLALAPAAGQELIERTLALVGGQPITLNDARAAMTLGLITVPTSGDRVAAAAAELVDRELVLAVADLSEVRPDPRHELLTEDDLGRLPPGRLVLGHVLTIEQPGRRRRSAEPVRRIATAAGGSPDRLPGQESEQPVAHAPDVLDERRLAVEVAQLPAQPARVGVERPRP